MIRNIIAILFSAAVLTANAADSLPAVSSDGLDLVPHTKLRAVYMKPGAHLNIYNKVALLDCYVAFRKNWQRDYNNDASFEQMVSAKDMAQMRTRLGEEFNKIFIKVLSTEGGHEVVTKGGDGVLIIRPAIINLDVTSPDVMSPGMSQSFAASAGQMTLYMELYDGKTGDIIARVIDPEAAVDGFIQAQNSVTNKADADRILTRWAKLLNSRLAEVKSTPAS